MDIRGLVKFSLNDYPGKMSCVIFTGNCNFRCPYCHNPHLVFDPQSQPPVPEEEFFSFLETRTGKLDAVVITGGEPSLQADFAVFAKRIKKMGFLIKLDTNSSQPEKVIGWLEDGLVDYLGLDFKAPFAKYNDVAFSNDPDLADHVKTLFRYAVENSISYDLRTTVHKAILSEDDLQQMRHELNAIGVEQWTLQQYNDVEVIDDDLSDRETYSDVELIAIAKKLDHHTRVRGLKGVFID